jgi:hypothetical protein
MTWLIDNPIKWWTVFETRDWTNRPRNGDCSDRWTMLKSAQVKRITSSLKWDVTEWCAVIETRNKKDRRRNLNVTKWMTAIETRDRFDLALMFKNHFGKWGTLFKGNRCDFFSLKKELRSEKESCSRKMPQFLWADHPVRIGHFEWIHSSEMDCFERRWIWYFVGFQSQSAALMEEHRKQKWFSHKMER